MDWVNTIAMGFATGLGVASANLLHDMYVKKWIMKEKGTVKEMIINADVESKINSMLRQK